MDFSAGTGLQTGLQTAFRWLCVDLWVDWFSSFSWTVCRLGSGLPIDCFWANLSQLWTKDWWKTAYSLASHLLGVVAAICFQKEWDYKRNCTLVLDLLTGNSLTPAGMCNVGMTVCPCHAGKFLTGRAEFVDRNKCMDLRKGNEVILGT